MLRHDEKKPGGIAEVLAFFEGKDPEGGTVSPTAVVCRGCFVSVLGASFTWSRFELWSETVSCVGGRWQFVVCRSLSTRVCTSWGGVSVSAKAKVKLREEELATRPRLTRPRMLRRFEWTCCARGRERGGGAGSTLVCPFHNENSLPPDRSNNLS